MIKEGQLLITFYAYTNTQTKSEIHAQLGGKKIDEISQFYMDLIEVPVGEEEHFQKKYRENLHVRFVDFNTTYTIGHSKKHRISRYCCCNNEKDNEIGNNCIPNDLYYFQKFEDVTNQWGLQKINPTEAYCLVKYKNLTTKIAILDTGIDPNHPDLIGKVIDPINIVSDDSGDYLDRIGHGTFVAGIAAATTNNQIGIASASYNTAYVVPIKIVSDDNMVTAIDVIKGIIYAIEKKVDVINMSFFTDDPRGYSDALQLVIEQAWNQNIVLVAAAGNDGTTAPFYPAANNFVLAVSATDQMDQLSIFSNWGINVGITAPGTDILSTIPTYVPGVDDQTAYSVLNGTSFSAPFVSGVAAMLRAIKPSATNQEIMQAIQRSSKNLNIVHKEWIPFYGYGLLDASESVKELLSPKVVSSKVLGSFYGQIQRNEEPISNVTLYVVNNCTNNIVRIYTPTQYSFSSTTVVQPDGMFRIINLPKGSYSIYADSVEPQFLLATADIVPGADVYVKLILKDE